MNDMLSLASLIGAVGGHRETSAPPLFRSLGSVSECRKSWQYTYFFGMQFSARNRKLNSSIWEYHLLSDQV